jgi:hypothetical protein
MTINILSGKESMHFGIKVNMPKKILMSYTGTIINCSSKRLLK